MCSDNFPMDKLPGHASYCNGKKSFPNFSPSMKRKHENETEKQDANPKTSTFFNLKRQKSETCSSKNENKAMSIDSKQVSSVSGSLKGTTGNNGQSNSSPKSQAPLADRMRPTDFSAYAGQEKFLGHGTVIRSLLEDVTRMPSLLVWGPPGCGKTSLANILATREEIILAINIASQHLAHLPEICIWQRKTNAKMGSKAALISLLSGTRGHENRSSHVNKH